MISWGKLAKINQKWIYAIVFVLVLIPLLRPLSLPISISDEVIAVCEKIQALPPDSKVLVGFEYSPAVMGELQTQAVALLKLLAEQEAKVVVMTHIPESVSLQESALEQSYEAMGKTYGADYVNLGFFAGMEPSLAAFCENVKAVFQTDYYDAPLENLPLMTKVKNIHDFDLVVNLSHGNEQWWIRQVKMAYDRPLVFGVIAIMGPASKAYLQAGTIDGLMIGLQGAAELESYGQVPGRAVAGMDALSIAHMLISAFVVIGNVAYFATRKPKADPK